MQLDDVLEWARDGKWHILETHPQVIAEAFEHLEYLRGLARRTTTLAPDVAYWRCKKCGDFHYKDFDICGTCQTPRR